MKFSAEFMLIYPIYPIMFAERGAISAADIGILLAALYVSTVLFEIPTGIMADKISRKWVLMAAIVARAFCMASWLAWPTFWGYFVGVVFLALSFALESGALQAYLYGVLGQDSKQNFGRFWARVNAMVMMSWSIAFIFTTIVGVRYPLLLGFSIGACVFAILICLSLPTDDVSISHTEVKPKIFRSAINHVFQAKALLSLLLSGLMVVILAEIMMEYISTGYRSIGAPTRWIPLMMTFGNLLGAFTFWKLHAWEKTLDRYKIWFTLGVSVLFVASFWGGVWVACAGLLLYARYVRLLQVQFDSKIQHLSNDEARATISSIASFIAKLVAAAVVALIGALAIDNNPLVPLRVALVVGVGLFAVVYVYTGRRAAKTEITD